MSDSNINAQSGEPQVSNGVSFKLDKVEDGYILVVVADKDWLTDPNRVYPIYIDPSTTLSDSSDTFVSSAYPSTNYEAFWESTGGYYSLKTGYYDGTTGTNYSFVKPNISKLSGAIIDTATFNIYTAHSYYPSTATGVWLDRLDGNWASNTLTWNSVPPSVNIASASVYQGQTASFNVLNTVRDWVYGNKTNYGFKLHTNGNGQTYWKKFYASENSTKKPNLSVDYHYPTLDAPQGTALSNNNGTGGYVNLSWSNVRGATGYKVWIYNGKDYESFDAGTSLSWTSKGKGIWPTSAEIEEGRFSLHHDSQGTELAYSPTPVYQNSGGPYGNSRYYFIRISAYFECGETGLSSPYTPLMPMDTPKAKTYANPTDSTTGYVNLSWPKDSLAAGYKVWIYNGKDYE
ncbi:DNRLRE domain-containing protein [Bacillus sp. ISL-18]|uniref:DNRLRE domain-containing protein n=1 Tax=Bacillus sp. ISL-18 TaxID=2819118 RepID=UPI001BE7C099|nr:DNRLRE domain-containing protein [Bacillus sp. ISL-18]MBT2655350.1 DNRLRE domain-containing protein [Bacillus sp. ISL-18]